MSERRKVAILGGGTGGLTTALELTETPELRERYEVTVYQLGWRLGGKGASGRREIAGAQRIEEHGLHVWFGFYENAFEVIRRVYDELERPEGAALRTWRDAFHRVDQVTLLDDTTDEWRVEHFHFPRFDDDEPGTPTRPPTFNRLMRDALRTLRLVEPPDGAPELLKRFDHGVDALLKALEELLDDDDPRFTLGDVLRGAVAFGDLLAHAGHREGTEPWVCRALRWLRDMVWKATGGDRYAMSFDLVSTVFRGILVDNLDDEGFGKVNDEELTAWLARHEAKRETLAQSPILRAFYQLCFAYEGGDRNRPCVAAGKALQAMLRMCCGYRGSLMWKMQAGMGDCIFAPLYEVLAARGVRFEFFTQVTGLGLSADGEQVARIDVRRQARVAGAKAYNPLIADAGGLPSWPAAPRWEQLEDRETLIAQGAAAFERDALTGGDAETLTLGRDFDDVVLAIPVGALEPICGELAARKPRFAEMLAASRTVATQALQVWLTADDAELQVAPVGMVAGAYVPPLDTMCDMTHLLGREAWPQHAGVGSIMYLCGVMADVAGETPDQADARARADGLTHLREHVLTLWPGAAQPDGALNWGLLFDPEDRAGEARLEAQYWRGNIVGPERYVITPPGSVTKRLRPSESGCRNLALAGDWTRNGICGGSVEAAVTSGKLAAQFLTGSTAVVPGIDGWLEAD